MKKLLRRHSQQNEEAAQMSSPAEYQLVPAKAQVRPTLLEESNQASGLSVCLSEPVPGPAGRVHPCMQAIWSCLNDRAPIRCSTHHERRPSRTLSPIHHAGQNFMRSAVEKALRLLRQRWRCNLRHGPGCVLQCGTTRNSLLCHAGIECRAKRLLQPGHLTPSRFSGSEFGVLG